MKRLNKQEDKSYEFLFGYEESYGYLAGTHARDKDAVVSSLLICEMAVKAKAEGKTLVDKINELYDKYGFYLDALDTFTLKGKDGLERINSIMKQLRTNGTPFADTESVTDYETEIYEAPFGLLPKSNVLKYNMQDGSWIAIRPSGTKPKIKIYYSIKCENKSLAEQKLEGYREMIRNSIALD